MEFQDRESMREGSRQTLALSTYSDEHTESRFVCKSLVCMEWSRKSPWRNLH